MNENCWIKYLTPELMYEFVKKHFEEGTYAPTLEEFKKSIIEPSIKNGYSKEVTLLKGKNKGNFYVCVLFSNFACKVVSKNGFSIFKGEGKVKGNQAKLEHNYDTVQEDYLKLMVGICGPIYKARLKNLYRSNWARRETMNSAEIQKAISELKRKHNLEYLRENLKFQKIFGANASLKPSVPKIDD